MLRHLPGGAGSAGWLIRPYLVWDDDGGAAADSHDGQGRLSGEEVQDLRNFCHLRERQSPVKPDNDFTLSSRPTGGSNCCNQFCSGSKYASTLQVPGWVLAPPILSSMR